MAGNMTNRFFAEKRSPLTYGITPPKREHPEAKRLEISARQAQRISHLQIDALVVYDLQDESSRTDAVRPFPFIECIDPADYAFDYLQGVSQRKIVYRGISNQSKQGLVPWLERVRNHGGATVLVGAPSRQHTPQLRLKDAYETHATSTPNLPLGGVLIAERHARNHDEHERVLSKMSQGCEFMITQAVYSVTATKNVLSDLHYTCMERSIEAPPILVTLSPCGSLKTLEFLGWLGVEVPRWLHNELLHAHDILRTSVELALDNFAELLDFARTKGITLGCNVESVSLRKDEIDASVELVERVAKMLDR
jgi:hypothetical protein